MRRYSQKSNFSTLSEINITPLLDLAFVLLIIFIITTPLMDNKVDLVVPSSRASKNAVNPAAVQTISIDRNQALKLNMEPVAMEALELELAGLRERNPDIAVVIRSHKELPVQKLVDVMDVVQRAQIAKVGVVTSPEP
jgi:biopolymer transport protein ExbD